MHMGIFLMIEKKKIEIPSHCVSVSLVMDIVVRSNNCATMLDLIQFTGKNSSYVKSATIAARQLQMLSSEVINGVECYKTNLLCGEELTATPSEDLKVLVFRKWLQKWEPYIVFLRYISAGDSPNVAVRKMSSFFNFSNKLDFVEKIFVIWGKATKIFNADGSLVDNNFNIESKELLGKLETDVVNDFELRMFLISNLTEEVFNWLRHDEVEELVDAFSKYSSDPRNALECSGRAYEDFLRRIANYLKVDVTKQNGITQVANTIYAAKDDKGQLLKLIHSKLYEVSVAIGSIRNMAGHGKEAKTMERWEISSSSSFGYILTVIASIKSIHYYVFSGRYVY
jgi:hypothetical protein